MDGKKLLASIAISSVLFAGCTFGPSNTIVKVNGVNISQTQFDDAFNEVASSSMFSQMGVDVKKDKKGFLYLMTKDKVVNELIIKTLIDQEMAKRNIKVTSEDTDKELKNIIDKVGSKEKFNDLLKENGITAEQFKKDLYENVKMKKLVSSLSTVKISDSEAKTFYKQNIGKFKYPDRVRASHILIAANPEEIKAEIASANKGLSEAEIQAKVNKELATKLNTAKKILAQVKKNPQSFAKVAMSSSEDKASAKQGGDLGFFSKKDMVEPFAKVAFSQKPNTISDIVKTPYGYHIIFVKDRMQASQEPYEKVQNEIKAYLENQAQVKVLENLIESLKKQAKIEYVNKEFDPANLQKELKAASEKVRAQKGNAGQAQGLAPEENVK